MIYIGRPLSHSESPNLVNFWPWFIDDCCGTMISVLCSVTQIVERIRVRTQISLAGQLCITKVVSNPCRGTLVTVTVVHIWSVSLGFSGRRLLYNNMTISKVVGVIESSLVCPCAQLLQGKSMTLLSCFTWITCWQAIFCSDRESCTWFSQGLYYDKIVSCKWLYNNTIFMFWIFHSALKPNFDP